VVSSPTHDSAKYAGSFSLKLGSPSDGALLLRAVRSVNTIATHSQNAALTVSMSAATTARMKATIWHNPDCGTSRKTLAILEDTPGIALTVVEYLRDPPPAVKLAQLYRDAGMAPREGLRLRGTDAEGRGLVAADDATVLAAMAADPRLIERPLVETDKGVRLCRPQDRLWEIL
jgi:arsenate reductase